MTGIGFLNLCVSNTFWDAGAGLLQFHPCISAMDVLYKSSKPLFIGNMVDQGAVVHFWLYLLLKYQ